MQEKLTSAQAQIDRLQKALKDKSDNDRHADEVQRQAQEWQQMAENIGVEQPAEILQRMKVLRDECLSTGEALSQAQGEVKSLTGEISGLSISIFRYLNKDITELICILSRQFDTEHMPFSSLLTCISSEQRAWTAVHLFM